MSNPNNPGAGQSRNTPPQTSTQTSSQHEALQSAPPGVSAPPGAHQSESWTETATNAAIVPVAAEGNDLSMSFDWRPVELTPNRSCSCEVSGASDHVLTVRIEQPPYDRTLRGQGAVKVVAIPSAAVGTRGKLIARDETSGATAEYMWEWKPIKAAKWITPQKTETRNAAGQKRPTKSRQTWTPASTTSKSFFGMLVGAADLAAAAAAPSRYAFILDMSGSMILSGNRWEICRLQLASALGGCRLRQSFS